MSYPQSTAYTVLQKLFLAGTNTVATGKTAAVTISKAGAAFGNPSAGPSNATELANGWYYYVLSTTDTNTIGDLIVTFTASGCDAADRILPITTPDTPGTTTLLTRVTSSVGNPMQAGSSVALAASQPNYAPAKATDILASPSNKLATNSDGSVNTSGASTIQNNITVPAAIASASQIPGQITIIRGDTLSVALPLMGNIVSATKVVWTAKVSANDPDSAAVLQIVSGTGLVVLNGLTLADSSASLTVTDSTTGAATLVVDASSTSQLNPAGSLVWDCQAVLPSSVITPIAGNASIVADVTRATS